jgi:hypothetical protein
MPPVQQLPEDRAQDEQREGNGRDEEDVDHLVAGGRFRAALRCARKVWIRSP